MLDQEKITIGKLKQAYKLSLYDANRVVCALLPDKVFPFALWKKAYAEFWEWSIQEAVDGYRIEAPRLREIDALPEEHFPDELCCTRVVQFFGELSRIIKISALENGFDCIIEAAYGDQEFPFKEQKDSLFLALHQEEYSPRNRQRTSGPREMDSMQAVEYSCVIKSFFDTIVVDKAAAVRFLYNEDYPFHQDVKGLTRSYVERLIADSSHEAALAPAVDKQDVIQVPSHLWKGHPHATVRKEMENSEPKFNAPVIAYVLYHWRNLTNKKELGKVMMAPLERCDKTRTRLANRLLQEAEGLTIISV